jgi:hypothetical protein
MDRHHPSREGCGLDGYVTDGLLVMRSSLDTRPALDYVMDIAVTHPRTCPFTVI